MRVTEFISTTEATFPYSYVGDFRIMLFGKLDTLRRKLRFVDFDEFGLDKKTITRVFDQLSVAIKKSVSLYFDGFTHESFIRLARSISYQEDKLLNDMFVSRYYPQNTGLYRVRTVDEKSTNFSCKDIFHVPLDQYQDIGSFRFSSIGHGCLYLSSSIDLCVKEVVLPKGKKRIVARYELWNGPPLSTLFLGYRSSDIEAVLADTQYSAEDKRNVLTNYICCLPLMIACYADVQYASSIFKPEYIIPQSLVQYMRSKGTDNICICYLSTKDKMSKLEKPFHLNYAFPLPRIANIGQWRHIFSISRPIELSSTNIALLEAKYGYRISDFVDLSGRTISGTPYIRNHPRWKRENCKAERILQYSKCFEVVDQLAFSTERPIDDIDFELKPKSI